MMSLSLDRTRIVASGLCGVLPLTDYLDRRFQGAGAVTAYRGIPSKDITYLT